MRAFAALRDKDSMIHEVLQRAQSMQFLPIVDPISKDADENHDGLISMSELTHYVDTHVRGLTEGQQHPGVEQRGGGELFIAGQ